jgi:CRISPR-associated endonuclease Cas2
MRWLIAYDIASPKRLRRVARWMERHALRCQRSVFWYEGDAAGLTALLAGARERIDLAADSVQAWAVAAGVGPEGEALGAAEAACPAGVVLGPGGARRVRGEAG